MSSIPACSKRVNLCLVCTLMQCAMNRHTHTLHCSVHGLHKYVHVFVFDVSLKLHMPPVVYLVGSGNVLECKVNTRSICVGVISSSLMKFNFYGNIVY